MLNVLNNFVSKNVPKILYPKIYISDHFLYTSMIIIKINIYLFLDSESIEDGFGIGFTIKIFFFFLSKHCERDNSNFGGALIFILVFFESTKILYYSGN